jgi:hypothetical protein
MAVADIERRQFGAPLGIEERMVAGVGGLLVAGASIALALTAAWFVYVLAMAL